MKRSCQKEKWVSHTTVRRTIGQGRISCQPDVSRDRHQNRQTYSVPVDGHIQTDKFVPSRRKGNSSSFFHYSRVGDNPSGINANVARVDKPDFKWNFIYFNLGWQSAVPDWNWANTQIKGQSVRHLYDSWKSTQQCGGRVVNGPSEVHEVGTNCPVLRAPLGPPHEGYSHARQLNEEIKCG